MPEPGKRISQGIRLARLHCNIRTRGVGSGAAEPENSNNEDKGPMEKPRVIYNELLENRRRDVAVREQRHRALGYLQLGIALAGLAVVWISLETHAVSIAWVALPIAAFAAAIVMHAKLLGVLERRRRAVRFFERALERLDGNWAGTGESGAAYLNADHLYAEDLDLFGKGSLFELLCTARTHVGEETLAEWLKRPAGPETVQERQQAVEELRGRVDLREDLAVLAEEARTGVDPVSLAAWGEQPALLERGLRAVVWAFAILGTAAIAALLVSLFGGVAEKAAVILRDFFLLALLANVMAFQRIGKRVAPVVAGVEAAADQLRLISGVLARLERETFRSPLLARLRQSLETQGDPASRRLGRLKRLMEYLDSRDNLFVRFAEFFILWTPHMAVKVEDWRRESGRSVRPWLTALGEMEALCSLASHAFEHPADPFPEFSQESPWFAAEGMGHPLLDEKKVVRNDVRLGGPLRLLVVSGSNMSGKSTLLRTIGVNAVLAQAGAPVRARRLVLSPLTVAASIHVTDSLQNGVSRFYAEILRIRQILNETGKSRPVLFLIDEFLHGTNSHDRRIGAQALVRGLVDRGAMGLITTHDLALADIAEVLGPQAANVHFEDQLEAGQMRFDYVMHPGVVRKSNALELMRSVGLEI